MCFSPEASFAGGVIISAIGVATVSHVHKKSQIIFAAIPLFFGIQQITEGFLWLSLQNSSLDYFKQLSTYIFLIMANVLWPIIIPLSVLFMEKHNKRKFMLCILLIMGIALASYYAFCLSYFSVNPQIIGYHIQYNNNFPKSLELFTFFVYLVVTISPLFISSIKGTHLLGVLMFLACTITAIFFTQYLASVWCFFAALISAVIFWILRDSKKISVLKLI